MRNDRDGLRRRMLTTVDARDCRRCQALLKLSEGHSVSAVAQEFGVTRQTVHNWRNRFDASSSEGLMDQSRGGRPSVWTPERVRMLQQLLASSPRQQGFHAVGWTVGLLQVRLEQLLGWNVSDYSLRQKLHELDYVWKRYRYRLRPDPLREKKKTYPQASQRLASGHGSSV